MKLAAALVVVFLAAGPAAAQGVTPDPVNESSVGGNAVDPTKNVLDLVRAESKYQDAMREAESRFRDAMREAETRRINQLAEQKQHFDLELARILRTNQEAASTLLATQLQEVKNDLSARTAELEQFRWETGGRGTGRNDIVGWIVAAVAVAASAGALLATYRGRGIAGKG